MRTSVLVLAVLSVLACDRTDTITNGCRGCLTTSPPEPDLSAQFQVLDVAGGSHDLQVSASLINRTSTTFVVLQCPLVIRFSPYPPGTYSSSAADQCPAGAPTRQLAPGDSAFMTRVLSGDTLALFAPGQYRVAINVTYHEMDRTVGTIAGYPAGIIQLPLDSASQ